MYDPSHRLCRTIPRCTSFVFLPRSKTSHSSIGFTFSFQSSFVLFFPDICSRPLPYQAVYIYLYLYFPTPPSPCIYPPIYEHLSPTYHYHAILPAYMLHCFRWGWCFRASDLDAQRFRYFLMASLSHGCSLLHALLHF